MSVDDYLAEYRWPGSIDLSGGISGWLRRRLDRKATACGQRDRHALFMPRVFELAGISPNDPTTVLEIGC